MKIFSFAAKAALFVVLFTGCQRATVADLPGVYRVKYSFGVETLTLRPDGTYLQQIVVSGDSTTRAHEGTWHFKAGESQLTLDSAIIADMGFRGLQANFWQKERYWWNLNAHKLAGKVYLEIDPDTDLNFVKTP